MGAPSLAARTPIDAAATTKTRKALTVSDSSPPEGGLGTKGGRRRRLLQRLSEGVVAALDENVHNKTPTRALRPLAGNRAHTPGVHAVARRST
jgi:hypothetical protein